MPFVEIDALNYFVDDRGDGDPLILLHGFTGQSASWERIREPLGPDHRTIAIDLIGHGQSDAPADASRYTFDRVVDDLAAITAKMGIERAAWLGYSMGGRLALALALRYPRLVASLILESTSPGIASTTDRRRRRAADEALAERIEQHGIAQFVDEWERLPLWQRQSALPACVLKTQRDIRLRNRPTGLAGSLLGMGAGVQEPLWHRLPELRLLTLLIAGQGDEKYARLANEMAAAIPHADLFLAAEAGHAVHLEYPELFTEVVRRFLATIPTMATRNN
jgi:2-succinyl-6-hydroxy-2,4-cyclohexadiene-1-carboxylate synthase